MKSAFIHSSHLRFNEAKIEAGLQNLAQGCPLGVRLHRKSAMGATMLNSKPADLTALTSVGITVFKRGTSTLAGMMKIGGKTVRIQR